MTTTIIISLYIIGIFVAYNKIKEWDCDGFEKKFFSIIWPLTALLYSIHWLHNR